MFKYTMLCYIESQLTEIRIFSWRIMESRKDMILYHTNINDSSQQGLIALEDIKSITPEIPSQ